MRNPNRVLRRIFTLVAIVGSFHLLDVSTAHANSLRLVATSVTGGTIAGNGTDVVLDGPGGTVTWNILLDNTTSVLGMQISADVGAANWASGRQLDQDGLVDPSTGLPIVFYDGMVMSPLGSGVVPGRGHVGSWAYYAALSTPGIPPGTDRFLGTLTVTFGESATVAVGLLDPNLDSIAIDGLVAGTLQSGLANVVVPEPSTAVLTGLGLLALGIPGRRDRRA